MQMKSVFFFSAFFHFYFFLFCCSTKTQTIKMSFYLQLFISLFFFLKKGHWLDACKEPGSTCSKQTTEPEWVWRQGGKNSQNVHLFETHSFISITVLSNSFELGREFKLFKLYNENTENVCFLLHSHVIPSVYVCY